MIWIANGAAAETTAESPLNTHIRRVIAECCAGIDELDDTQIRELAASVATYARQSADSGVYVDSGYLVMLATRALQSIGSKRAAHRMMVFGTGLVRPSEWEIRGGGSVWTLDLGRMVLRKEVSIELVFFSSLNIVLDSVAEVWDATDGRGTLGLRHLNTVATTLLASRKRRQAEFVEEVMAACRAKLRQIGKARAWGHVPELLAIESACK